MSKAAGTYWAFKADSSDSVFLLAESRSKRLKTPSIQLNITAPATFAPQQTMSSASVRELYCLAED